MPTVLHVCVAGNLSEGWSDPEVGRPVLDYKIIRTGEDPVCDTVVPELALKVPILGTYKLAATLNAEMRAAAEAHADSAHGIDSFDAVYLTAGLTTV